MRSLDPHISAVVNDADELTKFSFVLWLGNLHDCFNLFGHRFDDSFTGDPVAEIFEYVW